MGRRRRQEFGHLRVKGPSWLLTYRVYFFADGSWQSKKDTVTVGTVRELGSPSISKKTGKPVPTRDARRAAAPYIAEANMFVSKPNSGLTLGEFIFRHFVSVIVKKRQGGMEAYQTLLTNHICPGIILPYELCGKTPEELTALREKRREIAAKNGPGLTDVTLRDLKFDHIERLINAKLVAGYSVQTCSHIKGLIGRILKYAKKKGAWTGDLPTEGIELPENEPKERRPLVPADAYRVAYSLPSPYRELVLLMMVTGLRIAEALGLKWADINFDAGLIEAKGRETFRRGKYQGFKTAGSKHPIPLDEQTLQDLARLKASVARYRIPKKQGEPPAIADYSGAHLPVFCSQAGTPLWAANVLKRVLKPALAALGLPPDVAFHHFRHTAATLHEQAGATISTRKALLGHTTDSMAAHYTHADFEIQRESVTRVRAMIEAEAQKETVQERPM